MANEQKEPQIQIHKLYIKDTSFEVPGGSKSFTKEWKPELSVELNHQTKALAEENTFEVCLRVKATVKNGGEDAFMVEVQQAGVFALTDFDDEKKDQVLGAFCPGLLYPYAREVVSDLVSKGGFPQLVLSPVNFDAIYAESKAVPQEEKH